MNLHTTRNVTMYQDIRRDIHRMDIVADLH